MKNTKNFASRWGFILASVGSAVGMANVWGFPNKLGSNGGGAFLLIYLLFIFIFSYVGLPAEFAMGRHAATGTLGAYEKAWSTRGKGAGKAGGLLGWLPLAGSLCIAFGYAVIVTYILKALVDSLVGTLMTTDTASWFGTFSSTPYSVIPYHIIVVVGTLLTLYLGAHSIEKTNKIMMPLFFLAMYERNGQPLEVIAKHFIETKFIRPTVRPYKTDNYYAALMRQRQAEMEVNRIVQTKAAKTHKPRPKARGSASARSHKAAEKRGTRRSGTRQTR